jgi:hypothetical protein
MPKDEKVQEAVTPPVEEPQAEPAQEAVPTNEEVEQLRQEKEKLEQNLKSAQGVTRKQAQDLEEKQAQLEAAISSRDTFQALVGLVAQQTGRSEEEIEETVRTQKPDLIKQANTLVQQQEARRRYDEQVRKINSYQAKVEDLGLKETDKAYKHLRALVVAGDFATADEEIEAIQAEQGKPEKESEKPKESPEDREKRIREEAKREALIDAGVLTPEGGEPSATTLKSKDIIKRFSEGDPSVSRKDYEEAMENL